MLKKFLQLLIVFLTGPLSGQSIAFVGVDVIPMDRERVLRQQTVVVTDGRIAESRIDESLDRIIRCKMQYAYP